MLEYNERFDEYGLIIHDGGSSALLIQFCPWCGTKLPESKRNLSNLAFIGKGANYSLRHAPGIKEKHHG